MVAGLSAPKRRRAPRGLGAGPPSPVAMGLGEGYVSGGGLSTRLPALQVERTTEWEDWRGSDGWRGRSERRELGWLRVGDYGALASGHSGTKRR